jgi:hypothetical protein
MPGYVTLPPTTFQYDSFTNSPPTVKRVKTSPPKTLDNSPTPGSVPSHPPPTYATATQFDGANLQPLYPFSDLSNTSPSEAVAARRRSKRSSRGPAVRIRKTGKRHKPNLSIDTNVARLGVTVPRKAFQTEQSKNGTLRRVVDKSRNLRLDASRSASSRSTSRTGYSSFDDQGSEKSQGSSSRKQRAGQGNESITPTIFITQARDDQGQPRPTVHVPSSIYSRPTNGLSSAGDSTYSFPLEQLKKDGRTNPRESVATDFEEDEEPSRKERITSTMTVFEEDQTLHPTTADRLTALTNETPIVPTPHRSRGWWNVITTPFETSNPFSVTKTPTDGNRTPDVPALPPFVLVPAGRPDQGPGDFRRYSPTRRGIGVILDKSLPAPQTRARRQDSIASSVATVDLEEDMTDTAQLNRKDPPRARKFSEASKASSITASPPRQALVSRFSEFSPNDREVPIVLGLEPGLPTMPIRNDARTENHVENVAESSNVGVAITADNAQASPQSTRYTTTPASRRSEFSPIVQIAATGAVVAARPVLSNQEHKASIQNAASIPVQHSPDVTTSMRSSHVAHIVQYKDTTSPTSPTAPKSPKDAPIVPFRPDDWRSPFFNTTASPGASSRRAAQPQFRNFEPTILEEKEVEDGEGRRKFLCFGKRGNKKRLSKKRKCCCCCLCLLFLLVAIVVTATTLAIVLTRRHKGNSNSSIWVNITGYPPVPTGFLTVARPNLVSNVSGCVNPAAMWSCAVPKEQQNSILPNNPDQPNFLINIRYDSTNSSSTGNSIYVPSPGPPSLDEQNFLGNTTDHNAQPFAGETTPFFISFNPPASSAGGTTRRMRVMKRQSSATTATSSGSSTSAINTIPNIATAIPIPSTNPDGTALPANLLPFPAYQPLRLYNRGSDNEHYGFYTYFDRSIFLRDVTVQNGSEQLQGEVPEDANGGSTEAGATARCTWSDTRFLVQIWTRKNSTQLLAPQSGSVVPTPTSANASTTFVRPGNFPYPITVTLDRRGGSLTTKMLYCIGMDDREHIEVNMRQFTREDRAFQGTPVNPAAGPFTSIPVTTAEGGPGGIDGGSGGCSCQWQNFQ